MAPVAVVRACHRLCGGVDRVAMDLLLLGQITVDYLLTGLVTAGIVAPASLFLMSTLLREIARQQKAWDEKKTTNTAPPPVVTQPKTETVCSCERCNGSGKITVSSFKTWEITNGTDSYGNVRKIKQSGYVYEDQTCTRCLGSGKCK